ncbi:MAG TPA: hypothetical protein VFR41_14110, partial [Acidimicrobiia bacterium]|nr:hypothetical protein [Acidimicrobiia bacterium]
DVASALNAPRSALIPLGITVALVIAAVVAGIVMFKAPARSGNLRARQVTIAGADPARAGVTSLDLSKPLSVRAVAGAATFADHAVLRLKAAGIPIGQVSTKMASGRGELDTKAVKYLATGRLEGELTFTAKGKPIAHEHFPVRVDRSWITTAFGIGSLLLLLAALAYLESALRPLRRGRRRIGSLIGAALSGAAGTVGAIGLLTALGHADPTLAGLVATAVIAALAGIALAETVRRNAMRKAMRRAVRKASRTVAVAA